MAQETTGADTTPATPAQEAAPADPKGGAPTAATATPAPDAPVSAEVPKPDPSAAPADPGARERALAKAREKAEAFRRENELKELRAKIERFDRIEKLKATDPAAAARELGIPFEALLRAELESDQEIDPTQKQLQELAAWKTQQEELLKQQAEAQQKAQQEQARNAGVAYVQKALTDESRAKDYAVINALGRHEEVLSIVAAWANEHQVTNIDDEAFLAIAAQHEETLRAEKLEEVRVLFEKAPGFAERFAPKPQTTAPVGTDPSGAKGTSSPSLTSASASAAPPPTATGRRLSRDEEIELAWAKAKAAATVRRTSL